MPKRKVEEFFHCYGLPGVTDAAVRKVVAKLRNEPDREHHGIPFEQRFRDLAGVLNYDEATGICTVNLQFYLDTLCERSAALKAFFDRTVVTAQRGEEAIPGCIYIDEAVPGNVIAPDNKRRSWCVYFCWNCLIPFRSDLLWMPLGVLRTEMLEALPGGLPQALTTIIRASLPYFNGLLIGDNLVITKPLYVLADEDGIKKAASHKGAAGLRPCIRCANCISKGNEVDGYFGIDHTTFSDFLPATDETMRETLNHLATLRSKARLEEAEKLSGWKLNTFVFAFDDTVWELLKPSRFVYDAMHCNWCNGICCLELGLFWQAAVAASILRSDLMKFLDVNWEQSMQIGTMEGTSLKTLASPRLLRSDGSDYRGDATQTLKLLILMTHFAQMLLVDVPPLREPIQSLVALHRLCTCILNAKLHPEQAHGLSALQEEHMRLFIATYSSDMIRPKHHFNTHIESQVALSEHLMDTWPTERKNKTFKSDLAPRIKRLQGFERSILARWVESDINRLLHKSFDPQLLQPLRKQPIEGIVFGKGVQGAEGQAYKLGNILLFADDGHYKASMVVSCFHHKKELGVICQQMSLQEAEPSFLWSRWVLQDDYQPLSVQEASQSLRTSFFSHSSDGTITLLR